MDGPTEIYLNRSAHQKQQLLTRGVKQDNDMDGQRTKISDIIKSPESLAMFDEVNEGRRLPRLVHNLAFFSPSPLPIRVCVLSSTSISNSSYLRLWAYFTTCWSLSIRPRFVRVALDFGSSSYPVLYTCGSTVVGSDLRISQLVVERWRDSSNWDMARQQPRRVIRLSVEVEVKNKCLTCPIYNSTVPGLLRLLCCFASWPTWFRGGS